ncbi:MAG: hypothetical protein DRP57_02100 [Spirochaetes bacterium]|nr:MAG: hypothetical protein DRP57_02100 [Spirochaetota bacterium]
MTESYFMNLIKKRKSERSYDSGHEVADGCIESMVEAARLAPSASNRQPWHFIAVKDADIRKRICREALGGIVANKFAFEAPVIFILCTETGFSAVKVGEIVKGIPYHLIDAGIAGEHLVLRAAELGMGTCWIGWFNGKKIKKILNIPKGIKVVSLITAGYPKLRNEGNGPGKAKGASVPEISTPEKRDPVKKRKPLNSILHWDKW